jgi:hypothetical protein
MSDFYLDLISKIVNIGVPLILIALYFVKSRRPKFLLAGAFANIQLLLFFMVISLEYLFSAGEKFAYYAMWIMAGWIGPLLIGLGLIVGKYVIRAKSPSVYIIVGASLGSFIWVL